MRGEEQGEGRENLPSLLHLTPASSAWSQSCTPMSLWRQSRRDDSLPRHKTLSRIMSLKPSPNDPPGSESAKY